MKPGPNKPKVIAIIPAFNEEKYIGTVVLKTRQHVDEVIVADDGVAEAVEVASGVKTNEASATGDEDDHAVAFHWWRMMDSRS